MPPADNWECTSCLSEYPRSDKQPCRIPTRAAGEYDLVCAECLRVQFSAALNAEHNYPVKWQDHTLHPRLFPFAFERAFTTAYEAREKEYNTPVDQRVYCECTAFVAPMVPPAAKTSWLCLANSKLCRACQARWCLRCAQRCKGFGQPHECIPERRTSERRLALGALKKGRDYQICPSANCGKAIELSEACNAIECQCGTEFCYICGQPAKHTDNHWARGGCPRFGELGGGREIFDEDILEAVEADFEGEEGDVEADPEHLWEEDDDEFTQFDHIRWGWAAAMIYGDVYGEQIDIMFGVEGGDAQQHIENVRNAMAMYYQEYNEGFTPEQWFEIMVERRAEIEPWLKDLHHAVNRGIADSADDVVGGPLLGIPPNRIFNMVIEADREAGAAWMREYNDAMLQHIRGQAPEPNWPGNVIFDVGPGGRPDEIWQFGKLDMFKNVPALYLIKLAGGGMFAMPKPRRKLEMELRGLEDFPFPALVDEQQAELNNEVRAELPPRPNPADQQGREVVNARGQQLLSFLDLVNAYREFDYLFIDLILYTLTLPASMFTGRLPVRRIDHHTHNVIMNVLHMRLTCAAFVWIFWLPMMLFVFGPYTLLTHWKMVLAVWVLAVWVLVFPKMLFGLGR